MKIKTKLTILFLLISLIPIGIISAVSLHTSQETLKHSIGKNFVNLAKEKATAIAYIIEERVAEAKTVARKAEIVRAARQANSDYINKNEEEIKKSIEHIDELWIQSKQTNERAHRILNNTLSASLREYKNGDPARYGEIFVTDMRGAAVGMTKILSDYDQADEQWWIYAYAKGRGAIFIDDRGYDESVRSLVVGVVVPIRDNGDVIGILKINYKIRRIFKVVTSTHIGESDYTFLARYGGTTIIHSKEEARELSDREKRFMTVNNAGYSEDRHNGINSIMGYSPVDATLHSRIPSPGERKGISGERWEPSTWYIFVEMDMAEAFAPISRLKRVLLIIGIFITFIILVLIAFFAKSISDPIRKLTEGAEIIAGGELEYNIHFKSGDEIGVLAGAFKEMVAKLKDSIHSLKESEVNLEAKVNQRTMELQETNEELQEEIAEREQTEAYLMEKTLLIDNLLQSSTEIAIAATDMDFRILYYNPIAEAIFGYSAGEVIGKTVMEMHTKENVAPDRFTRAIETVKKMGVYKYTVEQQKEGAVRIIDSRVSGIWDKNRRLMGFVLMSMDITERKRMEKELIEMNKNLEKRVEEEVRAGRQKEQLLIQQSKMAAMGEMIGVIAHQWKQPLNSIGIIVQDILDAHRVNELDEKYLNESIATTMEQLFFMSNTIEDFRNFLKPSRDKKVFKVNSAIKEVINLIGRQLGNAGIRVNMSCYYEGAVKKEPHNTHSSAISICTCEPELITEGYPNEFKQVILNLLTNAREAIERKRERGLYNNGEKGEILIELSTEKGMIILKIHDNGELVPESMMEKIFNSYVTTKQGGSGIGLYMSREIIERSMGGGIYVENKNNFTIFTIKLREWSMKK